MPVPVPRISKPPAHPVIKKNNSGHLQANPFQSLTRTLPVSPTGPPPSYGTREEWIESLPSWRRQKPRRIWEDDNTSQLQQPAAQDFTQGLAAAGNATVIKGERVQTCIPPLYTSLQSSKSMTVQELFVVSASTDEVDDEMRFDFPQLGWDICTDHDYATEERGQTFAAPNPSPASIDSDVSVAGPHPYERGAFSPVLEEESPSIACGHDVASSPLEPVTPFCDFVDRIVTGPQSSAQTCGIGLDEGSNSMPFRKDNALGLCGFQHAATAPITELPKQSVQLQASEALPTSATAYKKLAEPLAEWMAKYVWKVCTTGYNLPSSYVNSTSIPLARFLDSPPCNLAPSIHSILLSTTLQPSAVFLALWYIVRLPVYCGSISLGPDHGKELRFRTTLFGEPRASNSAVDSILNLSPMDDSIPFRLALLGCILANKWLDDHTFSNKTWHSISNVPIRMLNELEILALDLFSYNLSVSSEKWSAWMDHILSHHHSLIPPSRVQPISRPSSNPHLVIRNVIEDIFHTRVIAHAIPKPAFIGLEQRKKERLEKEQVVDDIDLDEDGPLREEYLPRRRSNGSNACQSKAKNKAPSNPMAQQMSANVLPPPAKWSPAGDEPILRDRHRTTGNYVAVGVPTFPVWSAPYPHFGSSAFQDLSWVSHPSFPSYEASDHHPAPYNPYAYAPAVPAAHSRTHSVSHDGNNLHLRGHMRSYSQTCFEYWPSDIHVTAPEVFPGTETSHNWYGSNQHSYAPLAYTYLPGPIHQPAWIRT